MNEPEVSLILPTQGARSSLTAALRSALAQDFSSFELVVVDDAVGGSGWRSEPAIAACLADPRVCVVPFNQGRGCAAAKNAGWQAARGRWLCYLDDDNEYRPDKIGAQHALALASGQPVVLCGLEIRIGSRRRIKQAMQRTFTGDGRILEALPDTNVLFHRSDVRARWDEELGTVDDACLFQAIVAERGVNAVPNVPRPLVVYHAHRGARANRDHLRHYRGQRRLLIRWAQAYPAGVRRVVLLRALVSSGRFKDEGWLRLGGLGWRLLRAGGWREWRLVANTAAARLPWIGRWTVN